MSGKHPVLTALKTWITCFTQRLRCQRITLKYLRVLFAATPWKCAKSGNHFCWLGLCRAHSTSERWCQILSCVDDISDLKQQSRCHDKRPLQLKPSYAFCSILLEPEAFIVLNNWMLVHFWCFAWCWQAGKWLHSQLEIKFSWKSSVLCTHFHSPPNDQMCCECNAF